jgi:hypothetical protein
MEGVADFAPSRRELAPPVSQSNNSTARANGPPSLAAAIRTEKNGSAMYMITGNVLAVVESSALADPLDDTAARRRAPEGGGSDG